MNINEINESLKHKEASENANYRALSKALVDRANLVVNYSLFKTITNNADAPAVDDAAGAGLASLESVIRHHFMELQGSSLVKVVKPKAKRKKKKTAKKKPARKKATKQKARKRK